LPMRIDVQPKKMDSLLPTDILFQTTYWGKVKSNLGWEPLAFDFLSEEGQYGDVLVLKRPLGKGVAAAYIPQGPETGPDPDKYGIFLEALSQSLIRHMDSDIAFIRYDLPWESPYAAEAMQGEPWPGCISPRLQELRMNIGTKTWNLRKAAIDFTVADALIVDIARTEEEILSAMKPKCRYNIRLSRRKGVHVSVASPNQLPSFYDLYLQTARRNGFQACSDRCFAELFSTRMTHPESPEILFLLAADGSDIVAGAIIAVSGQRAIFLFGASSDEKRNLMGSYAVHWEAIKLAREKGCLTYDMGSVSPLPDPDHPFYGMHRFKTGFGGTIVHRSGSWDYLLDSQNYENIRNFELLSSALIPS